MTEPVGPPRTGERLLALVEVMDRLRSPGGCPWDARQTHDSLVEYLVEEAYETVEAIETDDDSALREELGDLLLQVVFHARIAAEAGPDAWDIDDVADGIVAKLVARHPHVFDPQVLDPHLSEGGAERVSTAEEVEAIWHAQKAREKGRESVTDGIPAALPALVYAGKVLARSAALTDRVGPLPASADAAAALSGVDTADGFGDLLMALVAEGRARGLDAESATRGAARRRVEAVREAEGLA